MGGGNSAGVVAGFAVAAGVGTAVFMGWGCAVASADDAGGSSAHGAARSASTNDGRPSGVHRVDSANSGVKARDRGASQERTHKDRAPKSEVPAPQRKTTRTSFSSRKVADDTSGAPAVTPQVWSLAAAARREFDPGVGAPTTHAPVDTVTTGQPIETVPPAVYRTLVRKGVATGPLTVTTGPPSLGDRLIVATLRTLRDLGFSVFNEVTGGLSSATPPQFIRRGVSVTQTEVNGWTVWDIAPKKTPSGEYVLALHGGGFVAEANIINWADYAAMARQTGATVVVPIYPLAPPVGTGTVQTLVPPMADYLSALIDQYGADNVSLYGDSAGGTYAMLVAQELVRRCKSDAQCVLSEAEPSRMVLISPVLDPTLSGPIVDNIDDPIIPKPEPGQGPDITGGLDVNDPRVNPISGDDLTGLPPTAIYVGTIERPYPGDLMFRDKLLAQDPNADFTVIIGNGLIHDWALGGIFLNSQTRLWRPTMYRQLGLV
ncbi:esterase/lipase [Mycolicibacterium chubuense NBB4]|uniref:Esterase/lipase n=1 Tax=Mycolicibacterium chubuense (strain NBB4) TaxID=710421 RepID=I4BFV3_MYCCN|nr:alpha/beta hydrolase [Mycolicibacterium chubuense]AFM16160.1 esterase/lipase [Mycolicibacterium chubuense NBB4]